VLVANGRKTKTQKLFVLKIGTGAKEDPIEEVET